MSELKFFVHGSQGDVYQIKAGFKSAGRMWLTCTCQAGENGMYCKHRFALMDGDITALESDNPEDVKALQDMVSHSQIPDHLKRIGECERAVNAAQAALATAKRGLARAMLGNQ